uniref:Endo-1,4-beta-D-glucanase n=1 Tax=unidentified microorganism TaxID=81726 RepID=A9UGW3_9ZZZZ|nr:endo-1,4-beta-D-glucanase [unidentified microorganism]
MKMFYLQRCGIDLEEKYAGKYAHKSCHDTKARIYGTDEFIDVSGAWHDAGDYGRYIVAAAKAVTDLMLAYETYPEAMETSFDVNDCSGGIPDILDEVKYELDWMLKMQDKKTGGVYHKVTCRSFPGFVMPEEETDELVVSPVSDTATCDFAASMAYAYRVYSGLSNKYGEKAKDYEKAADTYLEAAERAMKYLEKNSTGPFYNPGGIVTGEYGDDRTIDEYFWAYAEMYKTTGDKKYEDQLKKMNLDEVPGEFGWKEVGDYGFYAYLTATYEKDSELYDAILKRFEDEAEEKLEKYKKDPYRGTLYDYYYWGCNMEVANNAMRGLLLDRIKGTEKYRSMAQAQLHYLLGNNPNGKCFVTGFGSDSPVNPHHRPSAAKKSPMPGMLVGGPEPLLLDELAQAVLKDKAPAKCYIDDLNSYSTNEITIYWNSPLVFLLAYMNS